MIVLEPNGASRPGATPQYPVWFTTLTQSASPLRVIGTPAQVQSGWSGMDSFSTELKTMKVPPGGMIFAPYVVHDVASQKDQFTEQYNGIYSRGNRLFSITKLNGNDVFQPIYFGGKSGAFGAQDQLKPEERAGLAQFLMNQFNLAPDDKKHWFADDKVRADAARFLLTQLQDKAVADALIKTQGSREGLQAAKEWIDKHSSDFTADEKKKLTELAEKRDSFRAPKAPTKPEPAGQVADKGPKDPGEIPAADAPRDTIPVLSENHQERI